MEGLKDGLETKMDGLKDGLKAKMEGLTKLLQEILPNGDKVFH